MNIIGLSVGPLGTNCYILFNDSEAIIIDPGGEPNKIIEVINKKEAEVKAILLTHAHFDHIGAVGYLRDFYQVDVYVHKEEQSWLGDSQLNGSSAFIGQEIVTNKAEHELTPGKLEISSFSLKVIHTPGHSPGSVSFVIAEESIVVGGDVLFREGIGRTDLPGGSMSQLENSIRKYFYTLDDDFIVYPGHGPETLIGYEKRNNPFIRG
ncbi:MBL fold metallo-hydrolase [Oceanobacillus senegalensis]|uniref:MBL fold metallo-hydrolase n=1 Tax=Oceanobacillus senegalensis TaxID=1936063 RepID=UPI000A30B8D1|nr:MBL fold metallo-hydrolase [Oceanobacillus senegalensis]